MVEMKVTRKKLHDPIKGLLKGSASGLDAVLIALQAQVKSLAPVDTGLLRISIRWARKGFKGKVFSNLSYARPQEEGWETKKGNKIPAANAGQGYFKPAADIIRNKLDRLYGREIRISFRRN
ncbi:MAG: HK97 gp10 family phage protein [Alphaproteobacteria bacterium]|nr:HK97 gp10 family phage protein [Alphaproteobacteria bacterium]